MAFMTQRKVNPRQTLINELKSSTKLFQLLKDTLENEAFINGIVLSIDNINTMIDILESPTLNLNGIDEIIEKAQQKRKH